MPSATIATRTDSPRAIVGEASCTRTVPCCATASGDVAAHGPASASASTTRRRARANRALPGFVTVSDLRIVAAVAALETPPEQTGRVVGDAPEPLLGRLLALARRARLAGEGARRPPPRRRPSQRPSRRPSRPSRARCRSASSAAAAAARASASRAASGSPVSAAVPAAASSPVESSLARSPDGSSSADSPAAFASRSSPPSPPDSSDSLPLSGEASPPSPCSPPSSDSPDSSPSPDGDPSCSSSALSARATSRLCSASSCPGSRSSSSS